MSFRTRDYTVGHISQPENQLLTCAIYFLNPSVKNWKFQTKIIKMSVFEIHSWTESISLLPKKVHPSQEVMSFELSRMTGHKNGILMYFNDCNAAQVFNWSLMRILWTLAWVVVWQRHRGSQQLKRSKLCNFKS